MKKQTNVKQLSAIEIILYHLLPGIPILIFSIFFSNPYFGLGLSIFSSVMLAILFGLIPVELGILYYLSKKEGKKSRILFNILNRCPLLRPYYGRFLV